MSRMKYIQFTNQRLAVSWLVQRRSGTDDLEAFRTDDDTEVVR